MKSKEMAEQTRNKQCAIKDFKCSLYQCKQIVEQKAVCEKNKCVAKEQTTNVNIDSNNNSGIESPTGVYLEQKEYKRGENIIGAIRNSENPDMFVKNISVERLIESEWKTVKYNLTCPCGAKCEQAIINVRPHNFKEFNWDQSANEVGQIPEVCIEAEAGTYRIKVAYYRYDSMIGANQSSDSLYLYSGEFNIYE